MLPIGRAVRRRTGDDVTLVGYARGVRHCLDATEQLAVDGIEATVIDLQSLRPLDIDSVIAALETTHRLVTVEEGWPDIWPRVWSTTRCAVVLRTG